jgi:hypothetical protein
MQSYVYNYLVLMCSIQKDKALQMWLKLKLEKRKFMLNVT